MSFHGLIAHSFYSIVRYSRYSIVCMYHGLFTHSHTERGNYYFFPFFGEDLWRIFTFHCSYKAQLQFLSPLQMDFPGSSVVKNPLASAAAANPLQTCPTLCDPIEQETPDMQVWSVHLEGPLEVETAAHSSILAWRIHGQRSLVGYSPWGHKELDTAERLSTHAHRWCCRGRCVHVSLCTQGNVPLGHTCGGMYAHPIPSHFSPMLMLTVV